VSSSITFSNFNTGIFFGLLFSSIVSKYLSTYSVLSVFKVGDKFLYATLYNCKGLVEIVIANLSLSIGMISATTFTMLILIALITTSMTPILITLAKGKFINDNVFRKDLSQQENVGDEDPENIESAKNDAKQGETIANINSIIEVN